LATYQVMSVAMDTVRSPPPGRRISVPSFGDRITRLHIACTGPRNDSLPTIVLESDLGELSPAWEQVQSRLSSPALAVPIYRSCAYDRAGYAWSQTGISPRSQENIAKELLLLLDLAEEKPPYVLVGHGA